MLRSLGNQETSPGRQRPTFGIADGSVKGPTEFAIDTIIAFDSLRARPHDEVVLGPKSILPVEAVSLDRLNDLLTSATQYLTTPQGAGQNPSNAGLGPSGQQDILMLSALQGASLLHRVDFVEGYLSEMPLLTESLKAVREQWSVMPVAYKSIADSAKSWRLTANGFSDPKHEEWGKKVLAWTSWIVREKWAALLTNNYLNSNIPSPDANLPSAGRSNTVAIERLRRLVRLIQYVMRRPGFRLIAYVCELMLHPQSAAMLKITHSIAYPELERRAREFLAKEAFPPLMTWADSFVGPATFMGLDQSSFPGYIADRTLFGLTADALPAGAKEKTEGANRQAHYHLENWMFAAKAARTMDPQFALMWDMLPDVLDLFEPLSRFLIEWELDRKKLEDPEIGAPAVNAPAIWGFKPWSRPATTRVLGGEGIAYSVIAGQWGTGPASRDLRAMLVSPTLAAGKQGTATNPLFQYYWASARMTGSFPFTALVRPDQGTPWAESLNVWVRPQNETKRPILVENRFHPITIQSLESYLGEPGFIEVPATVEAIAGKMGRWTTDGLKRLIEKDKAAWAHLITIEGDNFTIAKGARWFESSKTFEPMLAPVAVPRDAVTTRVVAFSGVPAGLTPYRAYYSGSDVEWSARRYEPEVNMLAATAALAETLSHW